MLSNVTGWVSSEMAFQQSNIIPRETEVLIACPSTGGSGVAGCALHQDSLNFLTRKVQCYFCYQHDTSGVKHTLHSVH